MIHYVTPRMIADLANSRRLNSIFETAWKYRQNGNPVVLAIMRRESQRVQNVFILILLLMAVLTTAMLVGTGSLRDIPEKLPDSLWVGVSIICIVSWVLPILILINPDTPARPLSEFCDALNRMNEWSRGGSGVGGFLSMDEKSIREVGTHILVAQASEVLDHQRLLETEGYPVGDHGGMVLRSKLAAAEQAFSEKYDTLRDLGLASDGYKKYFDLAHARSKTA